MPKSRRTQSRRGGSEATIAPKARENNWLRRIFEALNLANLIAIGALAAAVPAGVLAWHSLVDEPRKERQDAANEISAERLATAAEAQVKLARESMQQSSVQSPEVTPRSEVHLAPTRAADPGDVSATDSHRHVDAQAQLTRPYIFVTNWKVDPVAMGKRPVWTITIHNSGRPTTIHATSYQDFRSSGIPHVVPTCEDARKFGGSSPMTTDQTELHSPGQAVSSADLAAFHSGTPLVLSGTFCYEDEITRKQHITHICLMSYFDGRTTACPSGNSVR